MTVRSITRLRWEPQAPASATIFVLAVGLMAYLRLVVWGHSMITLTYGLPLLICLFYPSRRTLWAMTGAFVVMSAYKAFYLLPFGAFNWELRTLHWGMQVVNTITIAVTVHVILNLLQSLHGTNQLLVRRNEELVLRDEEISRQNEELHAQTEELAQQNEEIQQQNEEIQQQAEESQQQAEELEAQTEELQDANGELAKREAILEMLLESLNAEEDSGGLPEKMCQPLLGLFPGLAVAAAVWERRDDELHLLAHIGLPAESCARRNPEQSLAGVVISENRLAYVEDLSLRTDLGGAGAADAQFRSVLAAPLRVGGAIIGGVEIYASRPQAWTKQHFKLLEWATAQCALIIEIRRLHMELRERNATLDELVQKRTAELQEMVNELEHFSYSITHDLRAPLRAMHGFAGMLSEECAEQLTDQSREYLRRLTTAATRMDRLITDALVYSKTVREELMLGPVEPASLLRGMIESYPIFQSPQAQIELDEALPAVWGNEAALTQCFSNLLGNAIKFVPRGRAPKVKVSAEQSGGRVRLWFEDNGIGIPQEMHARIFMMFQRASREFEGTGIGLALVRKAAERMGGRVGVESTPGQGSRFWVELKAAVES